MGKLLRFLTPDPEVISDEAQQKCDMAKLLIYQASSLLGEIGEKEQKVGLLLEDCARLLPKSAQSEATRLPLASRPVVGSAVTSSRTSATVISASGSYNMSPTVRGESGTVLKRGTVTSDHD